MGLRDLERFPVMGGVRRTFGFILVSEDPTGLSAFTGRCKARKDEDLPASESSLKFTETFLLLMVG